MIDLAPENHSRKRVHSDFGRVARAHMPELRLLVIGLHPDIFLNQRNYLSARTDQLTGANLAFTDDPALRRQNARVLQVGPRQAERGSLRIQVGAQQQFLRIQHGALALLRFQFGSATCEPGARAGQVGLSAG